MKYLLILVLLFVPVSLFAATSEEAFQRLVGLQGTWEGMYEKYPMRLTYTIVSDGAAVMESMETDGSNMVTIYHVYGDKLMATHYCKMKNQPRMVASVPSGEINQLDFQFIDGTNLGKSYTTDISIKFLGADQIEQVVRFKNNDTPVSVVYTRKK